MTVLRWRGWAASWLALAVATGALAEEPAEAFLQALRENGLYEAAVWYLERVESDPRVPESFRAEVTYQRGLTLVEAAIDQRDGAKRERQLEEARASLEGFLRQKPDHPKASNARRLLGVLLREWARLKMTQAERGGNPALRTEAMQRYDQAYAIFEKGRDDLKNSLQQLQQAGSPATQEAKEQREAIAFEYLLCLLRLGEILEEKGDAAPSGSDEQKKLWQDAAAQYDQMFAKYPDFFPGLRARMYQARTMKKLGDIPKALEFLEQDVLREDQGSAEQDNRPLARELRVQAILLAIECWLDKSQNKYSQAIDRGTAWLDKIRPAEYDDSDWVLLRLVLARANHQYAESLAAKNARDPQVKLSREAAVKLARAVARVPGQYQEEARTLLTELPTSLPVARTEAEKPPKDFEEAKNRANEAVSEMKSAEFSLETIPERLERETDAGVKAELQKNLDEAKEAVARNRQQALELFQAALGLAVPETPVEDLNLVWARLAYLNFLVDADYDAIVWGEFVCRRYPQSVDARLAAQVALAAYVRLRGLKSTGDTAFEDARIMSLANYIIQTWQGQPEAAEAVTTIVPLLIGQGKIDQAKKYVEGIPAESAQRGPAEMRIGQALWQEYLAGMDELRQWQKAAAEPGANAAEFAPRIAAREPELATVKASALEQLESGVRRMSESAAPADFNLLDATMSLAQIRVDDGESLKALEGLEDEQVGILTMLQRDDPLLADPPVKEKACRVALNVLLAALPMAGNSDQRRGIAERIGQTVEMLKQSVGDAPENRDRLAGLLFAVARTLESQLAQVSDAADRRMHAELLGLLLEQVRSATSDVKMLNWVAEAYTQLGSGAGSVAEAGSTARQYLERAAETLTQILEQELSPELKRHFQVRMATVSRTLGRFEASAEIFAVVLAEDNNNVRNQIEAAKTYQMWGGEPKQASQYLKAVGGAVENQAKTQLVIWGWSRIARNTQMQKQYRDTFHEARYNTALCHYKYALRLRQASDREKYLNRAKNDIVLTQRLFPAMGDERQRAAYDELLKLIQKALNEPAVGLAGKPKS